MFANCEFCDMLTSLLLPFNHTGIFTLDNGLRKVPRLESRDSVNPWITKREVSTFRLLLPHGGGV